MRWILTVIQSLKIRLLPRVQIRHRHRYRIRTIASLTGAATSATQTNLGSVAKAASTLGAGSITSWLSASSSNIVAVLIGLVLVAGAVWGFDTVHDTVISTAKGAAALAA